jgi:hypothetical protein
MGTYVLMGHIIITTIATSRGLNKTTQKHGHRKRKIVPDRIKSYVLKQIYYYSRWWWGDMRNMRSARGAGGELELPPLVITVFLIGHLLYSLMSSLSTRHGLGL